MSRWLKWHGWFVWTSHSLPWRRSCTYEFVCWRKIIFLLLMSNVIFHRSRKTYCMDAQWFVIHFLCSSPLARALSRPHRGNCTARHMFYLELSCGEDQQKLWQPETKKWYPWPNNILHKWHCALSININVVIRTNTDTERTTQKPKNHTMRKKPSGAARPKRECLSTIITRSVGTKQFPCGNICSFHCSAIARRVQFCSQFHLTS